jgi:hypothetical protein
VALRLRRSAAALQLTAMPAALAPGTAAAQLMAAVLMLLGTALPAAQGTAAEGPPTMTQATVAGMPTAAGAGMTPASTAAVLPAALVEALPAALAVAMAVAAVGAGGTTRGCVVAVSVQPIACAQHVAYRMEHGCTGASCIAIPHTCAQ